MTDIEVHESVADAPDDELLALYGNVYAGPPYFDGPSDVAEFAAAWPSWRAERGFRLVLARSEGLLVGFAVGWALPSGGWGGAEGVSGYGLAEFGVRAGWRGRGVANQLHAALLAGRPERRVVLWVRADAPAARAVYARWGYREVGCVDRAGTSYLVLCLVRG
ncbi:MAG TPA: GNAT family N-acetyltransferase [Pseudonocardiaceae bacterium]|jgi:GNAT superfamily N-acetyltransferase|nr:GNAT family N-acetyltransferase [Pseudonocardiaceae bacterium]